MRCNLLLLPHKQMFQLLVLYDTDYNSLTEVTFRRLMFPRLVVTMVV